MSALEPGAIWLPGWTRISNPRSAGGGIRYPWAPPRLVLHTDEVPAADMRRMAERHEWPPQLWGDLFTGERLQIIPLNRSGYALKAVSGTETNHMGNCIQIELHMRAADSPHLADDRLMVLGSWVEEICWARGIPLVAWLPTRGVEAYGAGAPGRMTRAQWERFSGVCLHQHVHGNSHWDAGRLNLARVMEWAQFCRAIRLDPNAFNGGSSVSDALTRTSFLTTVADLAGVDRKALIDGGVNSVALPRYATAADIARLERKLDANLAQTLAAIPDSATSAEIVQLGEDIIDAVTAALDGIVVDGGEPVTGNEVRAFLLELLGGKVEA